MDKSMDIKELNSILANQKVLYNQNREIIYANIFHDTIKGSEWLADDFSLSPGGAALGYPALYVLYRILNEVNPKRILEMGLGQSTKIISQYNKHFPDCRHQVVEHDHLWIDFFLNHFQLPESIGIVELPIKDISINLDGNPTEITVYEGFAEHFEGQSFDFICIDGPYGYTSPRYARADLMSILPECLKESFVIFLDDCNREGEKNTFNLMSETLKEHGITHYLNIYHGEKDTGLIVSEDNAFLCTM